MKADSMDKAPKNRDDAMYKINEVQAEHHHDTLGETLMRSARREAPAHLPDSALGRRSASKVAIREEAQLENYNLP